jgi:hypothetical protein
VSEAQTGGSSTLQAGSFEAVFGIPGYARTAGPVILKSDTHPLRSFLIALLTCVVWNGLIALFAFFLYKKWQAGSPDWLFNIFMIPFALIGLAWPFVALYQGMKLLNPRPILLVSSKTIPIGGFISLEWKFTGLNMALRKVRISLIGREEATCSEGSSTPTLKTSVFSNTELVNYAGSNLSTHGNLNVTIPSRTMHSFKGEHNRIVWVLHVQGDIIFWPDVDEEFPLVVIPPANLRSW